MFNRRKFLKVAGATGVAAIGGFNMVSARAEDTLNWSVHVDLTGPAAEGGRYQGEGFTE